MAEESEFSVYFFLSFIEVSGRKLECEDYLVIYSHPVTNLRSCLPVLQSLFLVLVMSARKLE